jgi:hypothetical protein
MKELLNIIRISPEKIQWVSEKNKWVLVDGKYYRPEKKDFNFILEMIKKEIRTRPLAWKRYEVWECLDVDGNFKDKIKITLQKNREKIDARKLKQINGRAVEKLCGEFGIQKHMATIYIHELIMEKSNHPEQIRQRDFAKHLGII